MKRVYSLDEARHFFLCNSSGSIMCVHPDGKEKEAESFPEAEEAFKRKCRVCGCTDDRACVTDGLACSWVEADLCSACVMKEANS